MKTINELIKTRLYAVVRIKNSDRAVEIVSALSRGGIKTVEIIVENPEIIDAIHYLNTTEDLTIMAGGIITQRQAQTAINAGAKVIVSPVFQMNLVRMCQSNKVPLIMTATTPNEAYSAWKARTPLIKIYPTKPMGGALYIEDLLRPMPFLNVIATGNIELDDFTEYLKAGAKAVGIGRAFYKDATPDEITKRAEKAAATLKKFNESFENN